MSESKSVEPFTPPKSRARGGKIVAAVIIGCVVLALVIVYLVSTPPGTDANAEGTPTSGASSVTQATEPATEPTADGAAGSATTGTAAPEKPAEETPEPSTEAMAEAPAGSGDDGSDAESKPAGDDAELAKIEQPVSEPVAFEEPSEMSEGLSATVGSLEAIEAEAFGVGEIAGPALRFVVTVHNSTNAPVALGTAVVNLEYGPEKLPAVQLSGSGAEAFAESVEAGGSATATLVFTVPADQRDQIRILLSVEASSPIAAFEGAAPGDKG